MSTSVLYHGWGVSGYAYERSEFVGGGMVFHLRQTEAKRCPVCRSREVIGRGTVERRFKRSWKHGSHPRSSPQGK